MALIYSVASVLKLLSARDGRRVRAEKKQKQSGVPRLYSPGHNSYQLLGKWFTYIDLLINNVSLWYCIIMYIKSL